MKKMYGRFNGRLFPILSKPMAWIAFFVLVIYKKKNQKIILLGSALGDVLYSLSFLDQLIAKCEGKIEKLVFVGSERYKSIISTYETRISKIVYLPHCGIFHLFEIALACYPGQFQKSLVSRIAYKCGIIPAIPGACSWLKDLNVYGTRNLLSKLYETSIEPISYHMLKKNAITSIPDFQTKKNKICVISPYSFSMNCPIEKFKCVCDTLKSKGFAVYTNVVGTQLPISGTLPLKCSLDELFSIACEIPLFVSIRSGMLDFLIPSNVNMFVVYAKYDDDDDVIAKNYSLQEWKPKGLVEEVYFDGEIDEDILSSRFQSYLESLNLEI